MAADHLRSGSSGTQAKTADGAQMSGVHCSDPGPTRNERKSLRGQMVPVPVCWVVRRNMAMEAH